MSSGRPSDGAGRSGGARLREDQVREPDAGLAGRGVPLRQRHAGLRRRQADQEGPGTLRGGRPTRSAATQHSAYLFYIDCQVGFYIDRFFL